jgi:Putative MetA-pathway of phenol degradation
LHESDGRSAGGGRGGAVARTRGGGLLTVTLVCGLFSAMAPPADAQTIHDVLSFLLTNRSVSTGDFVRDEQAAAATRDAISQFLLSELGTLPISESAGGFTYRLNPELGMSVRSSDSFGPFFSERSLTANAHGFSFAASYQRSVFDEIDGRKLRDGTLVATAARLRGETQPFDVETLTLRLRTDTLALIGNFGISDRIEVGVALPLVRLELSGTRIDTYRGTSLTQAIASGSSSGPGDLIVRTKYNVLRDGASGVALGAEARLPTGNQQNLLGAGEAAVTPWFIASWEGSRAGLHGNVGSTFGGHSTELDYRGALTFVVAPRLTIVSEAAGRRLASMGRLADVVTAHPLLTNVETIRLSSTEEATQRLVAIGGMKWNVATGWLLNVNVLRPLTRAGLNTGWRSTVTLDYSFLGR